MERHIKEKIHSSFRYIACIVLIILPRCLAKEKSRRMQGIIKTSLHAHEHICLIYIQHLLKQFVCDSLEEIPNSQVHCNTHSTFRNIRNSLKLIGPHQLSSHVNGTIYRLIFTTSALSSDSISWMIQMNSIPSVCQIYLGSSAI